MLPPVKAHSIRYWSGREWTEKQQEQ
ncbi:MAG: DUF2510 domain-containing protein [Candidatus Electrothrix sp. AUS1_2]|nr:DUF2510 domain-containing protein [Candidatus Electrothrix sp. AUS1_2]